MMDTPPTESKARIPLAVAQAAAQKIVDAISPYCHRVEIAGSVRREKAEVGDLEIVALPKWIDEPDPADLFGEPRPVNLLHRNWAMLQWEIEWIKPGTPGRVPWTVSADGKYWRGYVPEVECNLDLFLPSTIASWGAIYLIRTGSSEYSHMVATHARRINMRFEGGHLWTGREKGTGQMIPTPEERDVYRHLGLEWIEPRERTGADKV